jgi:phenylpyruvate tautomerase PptA (4-oxalocrotonate tautomerase family)
MPMIQIDVQPLGNEQRAELRNRVTAAVSNAIGSPYPYVSIVIRESEPTNLVEAGGWGAYDRRELIPDPRSSTPAVEPIPAGGAAKEAARG